MSKKYSKQVEEINEPFNDGNYILYITLIKDDILTVEEAAMRLEMSIVELKEYMK